MTPHKMPAGTAPEELLVGWSCTVCGQWVATVDASECRGPAEVVAVEPPPCAVCRQPNPPLLLPRDSVDAWHGGELIQAAFPEMPAAVRETLITGIHPACFDAVFGAEER